MLNRSSLLVGICQIDPQFKKHVPKLQTFYFNPNVFSTCGVHVKRRECHNTWL